MPSLRKRLKALPQEIYDDIFDYVFTPDVDTIEIGRDYQPPAQLAVSHDTRRLFAERYYMNCPVVAPGFDIAERYFSFNWFANLPRQHRNLILEVRFEACSRSSPLSYQVPNGRFVWTHRPHTMRHRTEGFVQKLRDEHCYPKYATFMHMAWSIGRDGKVVDSWEAVEDEDED